MNDEFNESLDDDFFDQDNYDYDDISEFDNEYMYDQNYFSDYNNTDYLDDYEEYDDNRDNDERENNFKNNNTRNKIIKILILMLIIILLIFILNFIFNKMEKNKVKSKDNSNSNTVLVKQKSVDFDLMFQKLKEAGLKYYDALRLEKKETDTVSLQTLITIELIKDFNEKIDKNNTIVKIEKADDDFYILTIDLKYKNKTSTKKYKIKHFDYCISTYLCEEKKNTVEEIKNETDNYLYEYIRNYDIISNWSTWSNAIETTCETKEITCTDKNCSKEVKVYSNNIQDGTGSKNYISSRLAFKTNGKEVRSGCSNFDYIKINNNYYKTEKNSGYKDIGYIKKTTQSTYNNWIYKGRNSYRKPPNDTVVTRYVFVGADYSVCGNTCSDGPDYYYDMYEFGRQLSYVTDSELNCNSLIKIGIPDYSIEAQQIIVNRVENNYKKVCYKKERTRSVKNSKEIKWSTYNDQELLNSNYIYSGNKKIK